MEKPGDLSFCPKYLICIKQEHEPVVLIFGRIFDCMTFSKNVRWQIILLGRIEGRSSFHSIHLGFYLKTCVVSIFQLLIKKKIYPYCFDEICAIFIPICPKTIGCALKFQAFYGGWFYH